MTARRGVHFCGSIRLPDENDEDVKKILEHVNVALPDRLLRLPDGEPAKRADFIGWQAAVFLKTPWIVNDYMLDMVGMKREDYPVGKLEDIQLGELHYDDFALESYQEFARLKAEGHIGPDTRFQVCVPTPLNSVTFHVKQEYREPAEQKYEKLLLEALDRIQSQIPHKDLAIQWDCPLEVLFLEGLTVPVKPHFEVSMSSVVDRLEKLAASVHRDVQLGFHWCYGDYGHRHFLEPKNMATMVELTNALLAKLQRPVSWVHMPVPRDRKDEAFFTALKDLDLKQHPETEVCLGLVHANDLAGTKERISTAQKVVPGLDFGVSTECGLGRTPREDVASIFEILKTVSTPVLSSTA